MSCNSTTIFTSILITKEAGKFDRNSVLRGMRSAQKRHRVIERREPFRALREINTVRVTKAWHETIAITSRTKRRQMRMFVSAEERVEQVHGSEEFHRFVLLVCSKIPKDLRPSSCALNAHCSRMTAEHT